MKKVMCFLMTALMVMAAVSCDKTPENDGDDDEPELIVHCMTTEANLVTSESARLHGSTVITGNESAAVSAYFYYSTQSGDAAALKASGQKVIAGNMPPMGGDFEADITSLPSAIGPQILFGTITKGKDMRDTTGPLPSMVKMRYTVPSPGWTAKRPSYASCRFPPVNSTVMKGIGGCRYALSVPKRRSPSLPPIWATHLWIWATASRWPR